MRGKTQGGVLKTRCDKKFLRTCRDCRKEIVMCRGHKRET